MTMAVIRWKGIKKDFSESPIDYQKLRKEDVPQPKGRYFKQNTIQVFEILNTKVTEIGLNKDSDHLIIFIPGGAFISGPVKHHWDTAKTITQRTRQKVWLCNYPKSPEANIKEMSANIDAVYQAALDRYDPSRISIIGDSVGGLLATALVQRAIEHNRPLPKRLILISPVMDASMSNPEIDRIEKQDPMLSKAGVISAKTMCAGDLALKNEMISPLYGSFKHFPETYIFMAHNDIMYPDEVLAVKKMKDANIKVHLFEGIGMPHIWPLLPVMKEAKQSLNEIIQILNS